MESIGHLLGLLAGSPWALAAVAGLLVIDGVFPFVPGETLVVGVAAATAAAGGSAWPLFAVAVAGALAGNLLAFALGRRLGTDRWGWMRRPTIAAVFASARRRLETSPASIVLTAQFLPVVRAVVPMTAGASRTPLRRHLPLTAVSIASYTAFHLAVGAAAATWLPNPAIALVAAVAAAGLIGAAIDLVGKAVARARGRARRDRADEAGTDAAPAPRTVRVLAPVRSARTGWGFPPFGFGAGRMGTPSRPGEAGEVDRSRRRPLRAVRPA